MQLQPGSQVQKTKCARGTCKFCLCYKRTASSESENLILTDQYQNYIDNMNSSESEAELDQSDAESEYEVEVFASDDDFDFSSCNC